jgi:hypothetical protein
MASSAGAGWGKGAGVGLISTISGSMDVDVQGATGAYTSFTLSSPHHLASLLNYV